MHKYLILLSAILLSVCSPRLIPAPDPTQVNPATEAPALLQTPDIQLEAILSLAIADLSTRLTVEPDLIQVLSVEPVVWPEGSLGCPRPGEVYTQQTVRGYQIVLGANGQEYLYHTDADRAVILCMDEALPSLPITPGEIDDGQPWMPVD
jgi:hypothetical protein